MASGQPDYTRQVAVTVFDTPDPVTVNVENTATPVNVEFPSSQNVVVTSMPASTPVAVSNFPSSQNVAVTAMPASTTVAVASVPSNMTTVPAQPYIPGRTAAFEDTSFISGDPTATHDVNTALGRNAHDGYIHNGGSGDLKFKISDNGSDYGGTHILKAGARAKLTGLDIDSIQIIYMANTEYYILVV